MKLRRLSVLIVAAACTVLLPATPALAGGSTTHPDDVNYHNAVMTFFDTVPCNDQLGGYEITATVNGTVHSTANNNGFWITGTDTGTFVATPVEVETDGDGNLIRDDNGNLIPILDGSGNPIPREGETFSGRLQDWFGGSINRNESVLTSTDNIRGVGSEGTTFDAHENDHVVTDGPGDPFDPSTPIKLAFDHATCR